MSKTNLKCVKNVLQILEEKAVSGSVQHPVSLQVILYSIPFHSILYYSLINSLYHVEFIFFAFIPFFCHSREINQSYTYSVGRSFVRSTCLRVCQSVSPLVHYVVNQSPSSLSAQFSRCNSSPFLFLFLSLLSSSLSW